MTRLIVLYPRTWRDRYETEFRALMAERPPDPLDRIDMVRGALDAHLHPQLGSTNSGEMAPPHSARLGAILAVLGGALWAGAGVAFLSAPYNQGLGYKESGFGIVIALAAALVTGLTAVMVSRSLPGRHALRSTAAVFVVLGALVMPPFWPALLAEPGLLLVVAVVNGYTATILGTLVFRLVAIPRLRPAGVILGGGALLALMFNTEDARALFLVPFGAAWILLGIVLAIRGIPTNGESLPDIR